MFQRHYSGMQASDKLHHIDISVRNLFNFQKKYLHTREFAAPEWTSCTNSSIFRHHMVFICHRQCLDDQLRTSNHYLWILRRQRFDERCRAIPKWRGWNCVCVCVWVCQALLGAIGEPWRLRTPVTLQLHCPCSLLKHFPWSLCPAQECGCKHLEKKGKHRLSQTPTQVLLLWNPARGSCWGVCTNAIGISASL